MLQELDTGFTFFVMRVNPWAEIPENDRASASHVGTTTGEALSHAALKLRAEAWARAAKGGFPKVDLAGDTKPGGTEPAQGQPAKVANGADGGATSWQAIEISFLSDERVQICNGASTETHNYAELGFADRRNGKPSQAWVTLRAMAEENGIIRNGAKTGVVWPKVEKRIQEIRKVLRKHFGITADPTKARYTMPAEITLEVSAERGNGGEIFIVGSTDLPDGVKIGAEVPFGKKRLGQDFNIYIRGGKFRSSGFGAGSDPLRPGKYRVHLFSHFNEAWQTPEILKIVGRSGNNLPLGPFVKLDDPNLMDSDKLLDHTATVYFPPLVKAPPPPPVPRQTDAERAINLVKKAILVVDGSRSSETVENGFNFYMKDPEIRMGSGWSARPSDTGEYTVVLSFMDGKAGPTDAIWTADLRTGKVQYRNKAAKAFSWIPKD
jgi:hypothetical protein